MTIPRAVINQAFPNQPRMQEAVAGLFGDVDDAVSRLTDALQKIGALTDDSTSLADQLAQKQPKSDNLTAIDLLAADQGAVEQLGHGIYAIRPIDAEDTKSLLTRQLADTRYLGGAHSAASAAKLATARTIALTGDGAWSVSFDGSGNVTSPMALATVNANTGTFGGATTSPQFSVDGKGRITGVAAVTITPAWTSITGKPTTLSGYGITDAQGLNANLTAIAGLTTSADKITFWTGAGTAALVSVPSAARTAFATLSGTNTGDQTAVSGNAGTATALQTPRTISITGKATAAGGTFDGTGNLALNITAVTLVAADIPNIAESQVTNLATDLAAKAPLASPQFTGVTYYQQASPTAKTTTGTLAIADLLTLIVTVTSTAAVTLTLPTGTLADAGVLSGTLAANEAFEWYVINLGSSSGAVTLAAGTGHTIVGSAAIAISTSARLLTRKTATNTFVTYRIA